MTSVVAAGPTAQAGASELTRELVGTAIAPTPSASGAASRNALGPHDCVDRAVEETVGNWRPEPVHGCVPVTVFTAESPPCVLVSVSTKEQGPHCAHFVWSVAATRSAPGRNKLHNRKPRPRHEQPPSRSKKWQRSCVHVLESLARWAARLAADAHDPVGRLQEVGRRIASGEGLAAEEVLHDEIVRQPASWPTAVHGGDVEAKGAGLVEV